MGLLYDQVAYEAWQRGCAGASESLKKLVVYEISDCLWLAKELASSQAYRALPPRPPHDHMWIERTTSDDNHSVTLGLFLLRTGAMPFIHPGSSLAPKFSEGNFIPEHWYHGMVFIRQNKGSLQGKIILVANSLAVFFTTGFAREAVAVREPNPDIGKLFPFAELMEFTDSMGLIKNVATPALATFCLLHCRNIETETVPARQQTPREIRQNQPPRTSYKVLRLNLPSVLRPRGVPTETLEEAAKMRLHLCRGHFKNLQHERYKVKGWHWWPAHWRGDPDLGEVDKVYKAESCPT